jgi:hypothetical protein
MQLIQCQKRPTTVSKETYAAHLTHKLQVRDADAIMQLMRERRVLVIDTVLCNTFLDCARADGTMEALELAQEMLAQMQG